MAGARADSSTKSFAAAPSSSVPQQPTMVSTANPIRTVDSPAPISGRSGPSSSVAPNVVAAAPMGSCAPPLVAAASRGVTPSALPFQNPRIEDFFGCLNC
jgi:hypothetical protein